MLHCPALQKAGYFLFSKNVLSNIKKIQNQISVKTMWKNYLLSHLEVYKVYSRKQPGKATVSD